MGWVPAPGQRTLRLGRRSSPGRSAGWELAEQQAGPRPSPRLVVPRLDDHLDVVGQPVERRRPHRLQHRHGEVRVAARALTHDHHQPRVEQVEQVADADAEQAPGVGERIERRSIAGGRARTPSRSSPVRRRAPTRPRRSPARWRGSRAPAAAARARRGVDTEVHLHVPELTGAAAASSIQAAVEHHAHADPSPEADGHEVGGAAAGAEPLLGGNQGVDVVVDHHRQGEAVLEERAERHRLPRGVRRPAHHTAIAVDHAGQADPDAVHRPAARSGHERVGTGRDRVDDRVDLRSGERSRRGGRRRWRRGR